MTDHNKIFGVRTNDRPLSYIKRKDINDLFEKGIDENKHILLYGGTKQGKTSFITEFTKDKGNIPIIRVSDGYTSEKIAQEINRKLLLGNKNRFEIRNESIKNLEDVRHSIQGMGVEDTLRIVVIENYHKIFHLPDSKDFMGQLRNCIEGEFPILFILIGIFQVEDLSFVLNDELVFRMVAISIEEWPNERLEEIIKFGLNQLKIKIEDKTKSKIIRQSNGSIGVLQEIMRSALSSYMSDSNKLIAQETLRFENELHESEIYGSLMKGDLGSYGRSVVSMFLKYESKVKFKNKTLLFCLAEFMFDDWEKENNNIQLTKLSDYIFGKTNEGDISGITKEILDIQQINSNKLHEAAFSFPFRLSANQKSLQIVDKYFLFYIRNTLDEINNGGLVINNT